MKRLISLLCVLIVIVSVAIPASASDFAYDDLTNLIDLQESWSTNHFSVPANSYKNVWLPFINSYEVFRYVEVDYFTDYSLSVSIANKPATIISRNGYKTAYIDSTNGSSGVLITFTNNKSTDATFIINEVKYSQVSVVPSNIPFECHLVGDYHHTSSESFSISNSFSGSDVMTWSPTEIVSFVDCSLNAEFIISKDYLYDFDYFGLVFSTAFPIDNLGIFTGMLPVPYSLTCTDPSNEVYSSLHLNDDYINSNCFYGFYTYTLFIDVSSIPVAERDDLYIDIGFADGMHGNYDFFIKSYPLKGFTKDFDVNVDVVWYRRLLNALKELISGNSEQNSAAEEFNQEMQEQADQIDQMNQVMDSVDKPAASDIQMDLNDTVSSSSVMLATQGLSHALSETFILKILIMAMTFALIGFVLYGKR